MDETKGIGLVLAGGGAKGAYQLGVWQALRKANLENRITHVAGTSVGAVNACMFAMGDIGNGHAVWDSLKKRDILTFEKEEGERLFKKLFSDFPNLSKEKVLRALSNKLSSGVFSREKMREIIENHTTDPVLPNCRVQTYATCFSCTEMKSKSFLLNDCPKKLAESILLASSALPLVFPVETIGTERFLDGGVTDNVPVGHLYELGIRTFIVVHLSQKGLVDRTHFPEARFLEIIPQQSLGNFFNGTLNFDQKAIQGHIDQGEREALHMFQSVISLEALFEGQRVQSNGESESEFMEKLKLALLKPLKSNTDAKNSSQK
ncbi:putative esterase of the alpha-beta hydrolase superfamily [Sphaerochaeta pleomorpha str. Grapes]|uniref:Putative esterase of the alpha-beta hydrolase superfamily n=1 Tax=Sphaerochaeta pleomorpha (strain ATCC BAA-1885 / DSM 22778 / Grapes) TaxID=158190 RepID=G8QU12_SPHPG|nr:patatin-like phospholipase family protein [Sphaerochaeta pleomorpha]AEV30259.1 putative esterase of the alpha-beta hydrolase superfamily [Sphaerochaeta pleomorpha str. Grapes]